MRGLNYMSRADTMRFWGAVDKICPKCGTVTPVYPTNRAGMSGATICTSCATGLQVDDNANAVIATYGGIDPRLEKQLEEQALRSIAFVAKNRLGIPEHELSPTLRGLPEPDEVSPFVERDKVGNFLRRLFKRDQVKILLKRYDSK